jgi:type I restriction enzyme R subunit
MTPQSYLEKDFEEHIEEHLLDSDYHKRLPEDYDKDLCLIRDEVILFIQSTQSDEYENLQKQYGEDTPNKICHRLSAEIKKWGTLHVLRKGFKDRGQRLRFAYYKPSSGMNPEHKRLYGKNRFSIVRQLKYSKKNENSLDITIFVNGVPIITAELKNSLTGQFVEQAIKQYKNDRDPREPLFHFKRCLVHFAVGNEKAFMTTRLQGTNTRFLPFNLDTENPVNPDGHKTAYLWEDILQPDTLLDLVNNYLHIQKNTEKYYHKHKGLVEREYEVSIFPRFHQLDSVRKTLNAVGDEGVGHSYLIQHSAGSGKSNSIAWLAHQLASFYQKESDIDRLFDSIIVVTDRKILDKQLQDTIKQFEQTTGVVNPIDMNSAQLKKALEAGKDIIITTLQKFPVISESMTDLKGKSFAVIVDEAHSSQSGESSKH